MLKKNVFVVVGNSFLQRRRAVEQLKSKIVGKRNAALAVSMYYGSEINLEQFKSALLNVSLEDFNLFHFKESLELSKPARAFILSHINNIAQYNCLIFEIEDDMFYLKRNKDVMSDPLFSILLSKATVLNLSTFQEQHSVQSFIIALKKNDCNEILFVLNKIFDQAKHNETLAVGILGAIIHHYSSIAAVPMKEKCFDYIWQADRLLKEGKGEPLLILEMLLVKLAPFSDNKVSYRQRGGNGSVSRG